MKQNHADKRRLASNRSARWAFMEKFEVPNYDGDGNYLTRWRIIQTPLFGFYLHKLHGPDPRPTLHDHPWNFLSIVLRGGYVERLLDPHFGTVDEAHHVRRFNIKRAYDAHAIVSLDRTPTWTFLIVGRRQRLWGYVEPTNKVPYGDSWVWTAFDKHYHAHEFDAALARRKEVGHV